MAFEFIKEDDLVTTFEDAKKFMYPLHQPFDEFERIARNKPFPGIDKSLPKVTDGTLSALISEQPKRIIQQIPTGLVKADDDWMEILANFILAHEILPNAEQVADVIQKCWAATTKALTYGSQPAYVQFINRGEYFGTDFSLPYVKDVLLEPGKLSDRESNVILLRTWWTKNQIDAVIYKEKYLSQSASDRGDTYESGWDLEALANLKDNAVTQKDVLNQTPTEKGKLLNAGFIEIVHCFQRGIESKFYSFNPKTKETVRTKTNPDPRGGLPIHYLYSTVDLSNPLGRGAVELSGGMQNLLDFEVQSYQYMRALLMNPPLKKHGNFSKSTIKYAPQAIWDLGSNPANNIEPVTLETKSLENFPTNYGLIKSTILNLNQSADTSIGAESGNPGFSRTPQGVQANQQRLGVSDNYMRKQFESWWGDMCETMINIYFAERAGTQQLTLDDDTADKLRELQPKAVDDNNAIRINYDEATPALKFTVDASSSNMKDTADQLDKATNLLELTAKFPQLTVPAGGPIDVNELADRIVAMSGLEDAEKIVVKAKKDAQGQDQQAQQPAMGPEQVMQIVQQAIQQEKANDPAEHPVIKLMESLQIKFTDLDATAQRAVLSQIGIPSDGNTATVQTNALKQNQQTIDAAKVAQTATDSANNTKIQVANTAIKAAELGHKHDVAQTSAAQANAQLADTQQARKEAQLTPPVPAAGVTNG